jgi:drug/metabolite transporter (DMT)-like permease
MANGQTSFGVGEILCALSGVLYGVNIAITGMRVKKLNTLLYIMIQQWVCFVVALFSAIILSMIKVNGAPIEPIKFSFDFGYVSLIIAMALVSNVLCWFLRTFSMKFVCATTVSVCMPFSAVVTGCVSLLCRMDIFSIELLLGGLISLFAIILSGIADTKSDELEERILATKRLVYREKCSYKA